MEEYGHSEKELSDGEEKTQKDGVASIDAEKSDERAKIALMQDMLAQLHGQRMVLTCAMQEVFFGHRSCLSCSS